jgi:hypothetical protein
MDCFLTNSKKRKVEITNNEKSNWPSRPIFVLFDWPDRKYTGQQLRRTLLFKLSTYSMFN